MFILDNNTALSKHLFYSGFIGVHQDPKTLALSPVITWLVIDTGEEVTEEDLKDYDQLRPPNRAKE